MSLSENHCSWHIYGILTISVILTSTVSDIAAVNTGGSIDIDVSPFDVHNKSSHVFKRLDVLNGKAIINVQRIPQDVGFFVIQVHSYADSVLLSNVSTTTSNSGLNGSSIGYVQDVDRESYTYFLRGKRNINTTVLIAIVAYTSEEPIPGRCNSTTHIGQYPYLRVSYNDYLIEVEFQAASINAEICETNDIKFEVYHMFLEEWDLSSEGYFNGIKRMLAVDDIIKYGTKVPEPRYYSPLKRYFNAYLGTGSVFAVVAVFGNSSSAYIPAISYACNITQGAESCYGPVTIYWKVLCGVMVFFGLFICFFGHKCFYLTLFSIGFLVAAALTYVATSYTNLDFGENLITLAIIGALYGAFWVILWCKYGKPLLSVTLSYAVAGYLIASIFFYMGLADMTIFRNSINYWSIMFGIILLVTIVLLILSPFNANIFTTSFLGSYMFIIPIDHYVGGNLRYIFLNTLHRATVPLYNQAVVDPPFQSSDKYLTIFWAVLMLAGFYIQWRQNRGRAPFPPHVTRSRNSERTILGLIYQRQYNTL